MLAVLDAAAIDAASGATDESGAPWESASRQESEAALRVALESLSDAQRRTLLLRYYGNLSFDEIASEMACPLGTVLSHCRRALATLRRLLVEETP